MYAFSSFTEFLLQLRPNDIDISTVGLGVQRNVLKSNDFLLLAPSLVLSGEFHFRRILIDGGCTAHCELTHKMIAPNDALIVESLTIYQSPNFPLFRVRW